MTLNPGQRSVTHGILAALAFVAVFSGIGYFWLAPNVGPFETAGARLAFALKADIFVFVWLVPCIGRVANVRFYSPADLAGSGLSEASPRIRVPSAILQNTIEQCLLAVGAHLGLAALLRGDELRLIPLLVVLFGVGRLAFWLGYPRGAGGRAFGFATTFYPTVGAYLLCVVLLVVR